MRYVDRADILEIVRGNPDISSPEVARKAYPDLAPGSADMTLARLRTYNHLQDLKRHGQIYISGRVPGTKCTSKWRAVA